MKKITTLLLILAMLLSTVPAFALEDASSSSIEEKNINEASELLLEASGSAPNYIDYDVKNVYAYAGYKSITIRWDKVYAASKYLVTRTAIDKNGKIKGVINFYVTGSNEPTKDYAFQNPDTLIVYRDTNEITKNITYKYEVYSCNGSGTVLSQNPSNTASAKAIRPMYSKFTFKTTIKLYSHTGGKKAHTFKRGYTTYAEGFGGGKFHFYYNDRLYMVHYSRTKNYKANYRKGKDYSAVEAENFVNERGRTSKTNYLIWVSTYTQHMYIFKKKDSRWSLYKHWDVATGKAESPTPTGFSKKINKKVRSRNGIGWWSPFQTWNSIHGKKGGWPVDGKPHSTGCVRNFNKNAEWVYKNLKIGTAIIVY